MPLTYAGMILCVSKMRLVSADWLVEFERVSELFASCDFSSSFFQISIESDIECLLESIWCGSASGNSFFLNWKIIFELT